MLEANLPIKLKIKSIRFPFIFNYFMALRTWLNIIYV